MSITFTQFLMPDGRTREMKVDRSDEIQTKAECLVNVDCRLEIEMLQVTKHLSEDQKFEAFRYLNHLHARRLWSLGLRGRQFRTSWSLYRGSDLSFSQLLTGLRRPGIR